MQIKRRYSINYSDVLSVRLFYPVPSVIIVRLPINKEAGTTPTKVWFPASYTNIGKPKLTCAKQDYDNLIRRRKQSSKNQLSPHVCFRHLPPAPRQWKH